MPPQAQAAHAALLQALTALDALRYGAASDTAANSFGARRAMRRKVDQVIAQAIAQAKALGRPGPHPRPRLRPRTSANGTPP